MLGEGGRRKREQDEQNQEEKIKQRFLKTRCDATQLIGKANAEKKKCNARARSTISR
jgi:hypothetical protein